MFNGGSKTRRAFSSGLQETILESHKTKKCILHIRKDLSVNFLEEGVPIDFTDSYVFTRLRARDEQFCGILYDHLAELGVNASDPINSSYIMSEAKISQMPRLARAGIRIPETIIAHERSYAFNKDYILSNISFPLVYKTEGSQGDAVFKIDSLESLEEKISTKKRNELFLIQEIIPNTFDTRTIVAYGHILGSIKRSAQNGNFLNNVAKGGTVGAYELAPFEKEVAIKATRVCKIDFGGVDIIHTVTGPVVLEVNKSPQIGGFEQIHGEDFVFKTIAQIIEQEQ